MKPPALLMIALLLMSCASRSPTVASSMQLYSPDVIDLPPGTTIQTIAGTYTSQGIERWYSSDLYMKRVREALMPPPSK